MIFQLAPRQLLELRDLDTKLWAVLADAINAGIINAERVTITSIWRSTAEDAALSASGIHVSRPHRAIDVVWGVGSSEYEAAAAAINARVIYDTQRPDKKVALGHPHGSGPHLHLQVHQSTTFLPAVDPTRVA